jgi:hypothetical protein
MPLAIMFSTIGTAKPHKLIDFQRLSKLIASAIHDSSIIARSNSQRGNTMRKMLLFSILD